MNALAAGRHTHPWAMMETLAISRSECEDVTLEMTRFALTARASAEELILAGVSGISYELKVSSG